MDNNKSMSLAERRTSILTKIALQREQMAGAVQSSWEPGATSTGKDILAIARKKPLLSGLLTVLAFLFFKKGKLFPMLATAVIGIKTWTKWFPYVLPIYTRIQSFIKKRKTVR